MSFDPPTTEAARASAVEVPARVSTTFRGPCKRKPMLGPMMWWYLAIRSLRDAS